MAGGMRMGYILRREGEAGPISNLNLGLPVAPRLAVAPPSAWTGLLSKMLLRASFPDFPMMHADGNEYKATPPRASA